MSITGNWEIFKSLDTYQNDKESQKQLFVSCIVCPSRKSLEGSCFLLEVFLLYYSFHICNPKHSFHKYLEIICFFLQLCYNSFYLLQATAPRELALQTRLSMNMSQLQNVDSEGLGGYGWVGYFLVISELQKQVFSL